MKLEINYKHLSAEFVVVFVGLALALAADGWRESLQERELEREYLQRLVTDLDDGHASITQNVIRIAMAGESAKRLLEATRGNQSYANDLEIVMDFVTASQTGGQGYAWFHEVTYNELLSTGRLNLIASPSLRNAISNYYLNVRGLINDRAAVPVFISDRLAQITASPGFGALTNGELNINEHLYPLILAELDDERIAQELGLTAARCESIELRVADNLDRNRILKALILKELDKY